MLASSIAFEHWKGVMLMVCCWQPKSMQSHLTQMFGFLLTITPISSHIFIFLAFKGVSLLHPRLSKRKHCLEFASLAFYVEMALRVFVATQYRYWVLLTRSVVLVALIIYKGSHVDDTLIVLTVIVAAQYCCFWRIWVTAFCFLGKYEAAVAMALSRCRPWQKLTMP